MAQTTRSRLLLFGGLYFAQGVPWGFFSVAIMLRLAGLGLGPAALGEISSVAWLPWVGKPLLGPIVDRFSFGRFGRRRPYILLSEIGMAVSLLAMSFANPATQLSLFSVLLFIHNFFAAAQDVGTDALAIDILPENERGRANGYMSAGKFAGVVVGGQGLLFVARSLSWPAAYLVATVLLLLPAVLVLSVREPGVTKAAPRTRQVIRDFIGLFSRRLIIISALFAVLVDGSDGFLAPLIYPLYIKHLHFSEQQIATLSTLGGVMSALGAIAGGSISDRLGRRPSVALACVGVAAFDLVFVVSRAYWPSYGFQLGYTITSSVVTGIASSAVLALFMDLTHPRLAATHFQLSMALMNLRSVWGGQLGGRAAERISAPAAYGLAAVIEIIPLALLVVLDPRKARQKFNDETRVETQA